MYYWERITRDKDKAMLCTMTEIRRDRVSNPGKCGQRMLPKVDEVWVRLKGKGGAQGGTCTIDTEAGDHGLVRNIPWLQHSCSWERGCM